MSGGLGARLGGILGDAVIIFGEKVATGDGCVGTCSIGTRCIMNRT